VAIVHGEGRAPDAWQTRDGSAGDGDLGGRARSERPTLRPGVVERHDLVSRLRASSPASLVVIRAPAGYGKSMAVALWEQEDPRPFAWVGLDRLDDDPVHLLQHVAAAVDRAAPVPDQLHALLAAPGRSVADELVPALLDHLDQVEPLVLVVDDVHVLDAVEAQAALVLLADGLGREVQLVLVSRSAVPVPLARRRLDDLVVEVGAADLALTADQARRSFAELGVVVDPTTVDDLVERAEGWAAGLHLAALATRDRRHDGPPVLSGRHRLVADYLVEEVLRGLDPATTCFLEESSVLEIMEATTLDEVLARTDARQRLRDLEASGNLLLVPLDDERERYRYHHLFGELLHERLVAHDPDRAGSLHRRAADHFEAVGDLDAAIVHARAAGDDERAASLVMREALPLAFDGRSGVLARRLALLGEGAVEHHVDAAVASAWYGLSLADGSLIIRSLQLAAALDDGRHLGDGTASVEVATALIRLLLAPDGVAAMRHDAGIVIAAGDWRTNPWWGLAHAVLGTGLGVSGDLADARRHITDALPTLAPLPGMAAGGHAWLALLDLADGDPAGARARAEEARRMADRHRLEALAPTLVIYAVHALVLARYRERAAAEEAIAIADGLIDRLGELVPRTSLLNNVLLAQADLALGDGSRARTHALAARRAASSWPDATWVLDQLTQAEAQIDAVRASTSYVTPLTDAERRVLPYLATHLSLQEVAAELHVSRNTAKTHSVAIYRKLGVSSRSDAVAEARRLGLLPG